MKNTKHGNIVLKCAKKDEVERLKMAIENSLKQNYEIEMSKLKFPRIKIIGMEDKMQITEIENCIRKQNDWVLDDDYLKVTYIQNKNSKVVVFAECSPGLFLKMMDHKKIYIGWKKCVIYENLAVQRCYKCQGFYHKSTECKNKEVCHNCSEQHSGQTCRNNNKKCQNCVMANTRHHTKYDVNHSARDVNCPCYSYHIEVLRSKTDYSV